MGKNLAEGRRDIIAHEKAKPQPLNLAAAYVFTPIYILLCLGFLGVFAMLMTQGQQDNSAWGIICLCVFAAVTALYLIVMPIVKKKVIACEMERYDFDTRKEKKQDKWDLSAEDYRLVFDKKKLTVNGESYQYDRMFKQLITENYHKRIEIYLQFMVASDRVIELPLNPTTLKMLESLNIKLDNQPALDAILKDKAAAFKEIYEKGYIASAF